MEVFKANYIRRNKFAKVNAIGTLLYNCERVGRDKEAMDRTLFGWRDIYEKEKVIDMIMNAPKGTIFFRGIFSPDPNTENPENNLDMRELVRKSYAELEEKIKSLGELRGQIYFIAAEHNDHTNKQHIHSIMFVPHRLNKEQFRAIAFVPRETATLEAREQRRDRERFQQQQAKSYIVRPKFEPQIKPLAVRACGDCGNIQPRDMGWECIGCGKSLSQESEAGLSL